MTNDGALPTLGLNETAEVLGVPQGQGKSKSNVRRLFIIIGVLLAFLFMIFGVMLYLKHRSNAPKQAAAASELKTPGYAQKNVALESPNIDRRKSELKEQQARDEEIAKSAARATAARDAAAAAAASEAMKARSAGLQPPTALGQRPGMGAAPTAPPVVAPAPPRPLTPEERRLAGGVLLDASGTPRSDPASAGRSVEGAGTPTQQRTASAIAALQATAQPTAGVGGGFGATPTPTTAGAPGGPDGIADRLRPTALATRMATRLPDLDYLLKRGTDIPCAMKTGIDTTFPGFVICEVLNNVYSANGATLLVDRGAEIFGEQQSALAQGQTRTFVVWTRIDNPSGVSINIDSPATDQMGYSGIPGYVDTHFGPRFGGAIMMSLIRDFTAGLVASQSKSGQSNTINLGNTQQGASEAATVALRSSINIPPTLTVLPGTVVSVLVARDVSFSNVYTLVK
jgi:type IV secretion system protein VirB10